MNLINYLLVYTFLILFLFSLVFCTAKGKRCPPLPGKGIKNGFYKVINRYSIQVICNAGYYAVGREYLHCRNGKWNQPFATTCQPSDNECSPPPQVENGKIWGEDRKVGSLVLYSCDEGYFLIGKRNRVCLDSLHWDGVTPECLAIQNSPEDVMEVLNKQLFQQIGSPTMKGRSLENAYKDGLDIIFLIDSSSSIDPVDFKKGISFIKFILDVFGVNNGDHQQNGTQVAVVTFDDTSRIIFNLDDTKINLNEAKNKLDSLTSEGGGTALDSAFTLVVADIVAPGLLRKKAKRAIFIITDATSTVNSGSVTPTEMSQHLKNHENFEIFAIGVGRDVDKIQLTEIASKPAKNHVFFLEKHTVFDEILFNIKNKPATTSSAPVTPEQCGKPPLKNASLASPWIAAIYIDVNDNLEFCAGVLICSQWVLTSARCILYNSMTVNASQVFVTLGDHDLTEEDGKEINMYVVDIKLSPEMNGSGDAYIQLALLKLHRETPSDFAYQPICLPEESITEIPLSLDLKTNASLEGWGVPNNNFTSNVLSAATLVPVSKKINTEIVASSICTKAINKYHGNVSVDLKNNLMCAGTEFGPSKCSGNLGSPLVARDKGDYHHVIGILSEDHGCANVPNVFVRVLPYRNWIYNATEDCPSKHTTL